MNISERDKIYFWMGLSVVLIGAKFESLGLAFWGCFVMALPMIAAHYGKKNDE